MKKGNTISLLSMIVMVFLSLGLWSDNANATDTKAWELDSKGNLIIHSEHITEQPLFIPIDMDGIKMEILAVRSHDSLVRVAFNTCQVCSGSPKAYFAPENGGVVCQNCGNFFPMEQVGGSARGCNPLAIPGISPVSSGTIVIKASVMGAHSRAFRNWKKGL